MSTEQGFFDGKDFDGAFKALMPEYYPPEYQRYAAEEAALLKEKLAGAKTVLEAGVGIGRVIPDIAPVVGTLVGIDVSEHMLAEAEKVAEKFRNVQIRRGDVNTLGELFPENNFTHSLCVWNTLGNVEDDAHALVELAKVTQGSIFVTTYLKGTLAERKNWYDTLGIAIKDIDEENEIFYSESGLRSKSYSPEDMVLLAERTGLQVADSQALAGVMLWTEFRKPVAASRS